MIVLYFLINLIWWMIRSITDALLSWHYRRRRYREDAKGRWWDSRENLQVRSVASYRSWDVYRAWILHRSGFDDVVQVPGGDRGSKDDVAYYPVEHLSPVLRYTLISTPPARKCMKTSTHSPSSASRPNCTTSAYYPSLNYSPLTAKIAPCLLPPFARLPRFSASLHFLG